MGVSSGDEDGDGVDGDGSGGNSPSRQRAGTETSVPRNLSSMAAALRLRHYSHSIKIHSIKVSNLVVVQLLSRF